MDTNSPWKQLDSRIAYENPWIKIREDRVIRPDGTEGIYGVLMTPPSVYVVALSEKNEVYINRQFRYPTQKYSWELPAGSSDGQDPLAAAQRELKEETGLIAEDWQEVGTIQALNGICSEISHVFIARNLTQTLENSQDEEGITDMRAVAIPELFSMTTSGEFDDGQSIAAIMKAMLFLGMVRV